MSFKASETIEDICPICEEKRHIEIGTQIETLKIRNKSIRINATVEKCTSCNEIFATTEQEENNIQDAYRKYRQEANLLQPEEIKAIRKKYKLSQKLFAQLLGWGDVTLHRYESGALQDEVHNDLLLLLDELNNFSTLFNKNKHRLTVKQAEDIQVDLRKALEKASIFMNPSLLAHSLGRNVTASSCHPANENIWGNSPSTVFSRVEESNSANKPNDTYAANEPLALAA